MILERSLRLRINCSIPLAGEVWIKKSRAPEGSTRSVDAAGARYFEVPLGLAIFSLHSGSPLAVSSTCMLMTIQSPWSRAAARVLLALIRDSFYPEYPIGFRDGGRKRNGSNGFVERLR